MPDMNIGQAFMAPMLDMQNLAKGDLAMQATRQGMAAQRLNMQKTQMEISNQQRIQPVMSQMASSGTDTGKEMNPADQLDHAAELFMRAGLVEQASKYAEKASAIRLHQANTLRADASRDQAIAATQAKNFDIADNLLGRVTDQASLDAANAEYERLTGTQSPLRGAQYSPQLIRDAQDHILEQRGKLTNAMREKEEQRKVAKDRNDAAFKATRIRLLEENLKLRKEREGRLGKVSGKNSDMGAPPKQLRDAAFDRIKSEFKNLPDEEAANASFYVASRAQAIRKTNPGMDAGQALEQALTEAKASHDFSTVDKMYLGFKTGTKQTYKSHGTSPATPMPMEADPSKRVVGKYYTQGGNVYQWKGNGWLPVTNTGSEDQGDSGGDDLGDSDYSE